MRFETTPAFDGDYRRLKPEHRATFRLVIKERFGPACDAYAADASTPWPSTLRVKPVRNAAGIREMTWSFAGPDGRATFELITFEGDPRCRWRKIGDHKAFKRP